MAPQVKRRGPPKRYCSRKCKHRALGRRSFARDPRPQRLRTQLWKYGLTEAAYNSMVLAQTGRCAICLRPSNLVIDHDHATGAVRALLCGNCNTALGLLGDDPNRIDNAAQDLRLHRKAP